MNNENAPGVAPVTSAERIGEMDVLRGFALLGVMLANLGWFAFTDFTSTPEQRDAWTSNPADWYSMIALQWLVSDKANTLFATLFGIGFWVMMERLKARGGDFERIYLRRLTIMLLFGLAHFLLLWPWDILHMYAIVGFALFAMRGLSMRAMLWIGLPLALFAKPLVDMIRKETGLDEWSRGFVFGEEAEAVRQNVIAGSDYFAWVGEFARLAYYEYIVGGVFVAWWLYVLGRFLVGAWIARKGWLSRTRELLPNIRKIFLICLPLGLALEGVATAFEFDYLEGPKHVDKFIHYVGVPILDVGYATGLILLFNSNSWSFLARMFAPVGRMALTNYVVQSFFYFFLLTGIGPGLSMVGKLGPSQTLPMCFAFFAAQIVFSYMWLKAYRFGPLEWCWRALTYGEKPRMRLAKG